MQMHRHICIFTLMLMINVHIYSIYTLALLRYLLTQPSKLYIILNNACELDACCNLSPPFETCLYVYAVSNCSVRFEMLLFSCTLYDHESQRARYRPFTCMNTQRGALK